MADWFLINPSWNAWMSYVNSATGLVDSSSIVLQPSTRLNASLGEYLQTACASHLELAEKCLEPFDKIYNSSLSVSCLNQKKQEK